MKMKKILAMLLAVLMIVTATVAGTIAWLQVETENVVNTFTATDIDITLTEDTTEYEMVPGETIDKDPVVTVIGGSEACWLFVEVTESTDPDLDTYIAYAIDTGWTVVPGYDVDNDSYVIYRAVDASDEDQPFSILGAGSYTDETLNYTVTWGQNQVGVKPSVTKTDMTAIKTNMPTLTFKAYAVQKANVADAETAWEIAQGLATT